MANEKRLIDANAFLKDILIGCHFPICRKENDYD